MGPALSDEAHANSFTCQKPKPKFVSADPEGEGRGGGGGSVGRPTLMSFENPPSAEPNGVSNPAPPDAEASGAGSAGGGGGGGSVGRPMPKLFENPPSAEPKGVSKPAPPDAEASGAGSAGGGGGGGSVGRSNPNSPPPDPSAPMSASAVPAPANEKASAAATTPVIFKVVRTVDSDNKVFPLSVVGFGTTPRGDANNIDRRAQRPPAPGRAQQRPAPHTEGGNPKSTAPTPGIRENVDNRRVFARPTTAASVATRTISEFTTLRQEKRAKAERVPAGV